MRQPSSRLLSSTSSVAAAGNRLKTTEVARFVASGHLSFHGLIAEDLNREAAAEIRRGGLSVLSGDPQPLENSFPWDSPIRAALEHPVIRGAIQSLVGPAPLVDHADAHIRRPGTASCQMLHADAIVDRSPGFDIQVMYFPEGARQQDGPTLVVPGSHLRSVHANQPARYKNFLGATRLICPPGSIAILHHGIWHGGTGNSGHRDRLMFKVRLTPTVAQVLLWDTADLDDETVIAILETEHPWTDIGSARLDVVKRVKLWRALTGRPDFDVGQHWLRRTERRGRLSIRDGHED